MLIFYLSLSLPTLTWTFQGFSCLLLYLVGSFSVSGPNYNSFSKFRIRERAVTYPISDLRKWIVAKYTPKPGIQRCNACEKRGEMIQVMGQSEQARKGMHRYTSTFLQSVLMKETQPAPPLTNRKCLIIIYISNEIMKFGSDWLTKSLDNKTEMLWTCAVTSYMWSCSKAIP